MGVEKRVIHTGRYALPLLILAVGAAALWPVRHALTAETIAALSPRQTFWRHRSWWGCTPSRASRSAFRCPP